MGMIQVGNRSAQRDAHEPVEGLNVYHEIISSVVDTVFAAGSGNLTLHPLREGVSYIFTSLPGGPAAVNVVGDTVQMVYDPGVTTNAIEAGLVAAHAQASEMLEVQVSVVENLPASLNNVTGDLFLQLRGVPGAMFWLDPSDGKWKPWQGEVFAGSDPDAFLNDNRYQVVTHSLAAALADHALGLAGRNLTILLLNGNATYKLNDVANDPVDAVIGTTWDKTDVTEVYLTCAAQPGGSITFVCGRRA